VSDGLGEPAKVALVTGANKGIGLAIAAGLGRRGYHVLAGSRDHRRGETAVAQLREEGLTATFLPLDVTSDDTVEAAVAWIADRFGWLDALVNNAAIKLEFSPSPPSQASLGVVRKTFDTNVFGTMAVIQAMLPLLLKSDAGRIVNLSSGLGSLGLATTDGSKYQEKPLLSYNVSKSAVNSLTVQFANELRGTSIKVNAADPGFTNTDMTLGTGTRTPQQAAQIAVRLATLGPDGPTGGFFDERGPIPW
jgi:NAD(P)-dependent dehydrogenase (short-subunit alcohol dehydrogenase family)